MHRTTSHHRTTATQRSKARRRNKAFRATAARVGFGIGHSIMFALVAGALLAYGHAAANGF